MAEEPIYDKDGNLVLDLDQAEYEDNSEQLDIELDAKAYSEERSAKLSTSGDETQGEAPEPPELVLDPVEGDGEDPVEGEGEDPVEGDGEDPVEGEGSLPSEGEGEDPVEGEGEDPVEGGETPEIEYPEEVEPAVMAPQAITYVADSTGSALITKGSIGIKKVVMDSASGLASGSWTLVGDTITFNKAKLDTSESGIYTFTITFEDDSENVFELKVLSAGVVEEYWQQNITTFSKDSRSNDYKDLELTSSNGNVKLYDVSISGKAVPKTKYTLVKGILIISKDYLSTLPVSDRSRVSVEYTGGLTVDFSLKIVDDMESSNALDTKGC